MNIKQFIKNLDIKVFVEIGSHFCVDTRDFRKMHPNARIVCFEPDPRNIEMIKKLGNDKICELYQLALSDTNEVTNFYLSSGDARKKPIEEVYRTSEWTASSSLKKPTGHIVQHTWITFPNVVKVKCSKLDDFLPLKNTKIDFMWVDVQGAEDLVFSSAQETLKNTHYLYTEYSNIELYEKQLKLQQIIDLVGTSFEIIYDYGGDVLLKNLKFLND
jgi:FkbM family methyltransferase